MTDEDYMQLTGITETQFDQALECIPSLRSTSIRSSRTAPALLLVKLRTGLSLAILPTIIGIKKRYCRKAIHSARIA